MARREEVTRTRSDSGAPARNSVARPFTYRSPERDVADLAWFPRRWQAVEDSGRIPWPVRNAGLPGALCGANPHTPLDECSLTISGQVDEPVSWKWEEFLSPLDPIRRRAAATRPGEEHV